MISRRFSTGEFLWYTTVFSVVFGGWFLDNPNALLAGPAFVLTGAIVAGPIGLALGGRTWFIPAAILGSLVWFVLILIPAMNTVR